MLKHFMVQKNSGKVLLLLAFFMGVTSLYSGCRSKTKVKFSSNKMRAAAAANTSTETPAEAPPPSDTNTNTVVPPRQISAEFERSRYQTLSTKTFLVDGNAVDPLTSLSVSFATKTLPGSVAAYTGDDAAVDPLITKMVHFNSSAEVLQSLNYGENTLDYLIKDRDNILAQSDVAQTVVLKDFYLFDFTPLADAAPQSMGVGGNVFQMWIPAVSSGVFQSSDKSSHLVVGFNDIINY